eukprot:m.60500 g.60500  ORF g.60500 m.60500 type:complete len:217 (-) comp7958_c2_seq1:473-1123(-)
MASVCSPSIRSCARTAAASLARHTRPYPSLRTTRYLTASAASHTHTTCHGALLRNSIPPSCCSTWTLHRPSVVGYGGMVSGCGDTRGRPVGARWMATGFEDVNTFHKVADEVMEQLNDDFNDLADDHPDGATFDVSFGDGVLSVTLGDHGTYVINKQTPNQQIWLSSPTSGPKRYDYDRDRHEWVYSHDNIALHQRLTDEISSILGDTIEFRLPDQ